MVFLTATLLFHAGFSLLLARFQHRSSGIWRGSRLLCLAGACLLAGICLGLYLNGDLPPQRGVPGGIFMVYGACALLAGVLYVVPPVSFHRRAGGETFLWGGLGLLPVLGAYLVQVGDLTRTVYLAASPLVAATALWVWIDEVMTRADDEKEGRRTLVILFGPRFSGRFAVPVLALLFYGTLILAVASFSIAPWALAIVLTIGLVRAIITLSGGEYGGSARLDAARRRAFLVHVVTGIITVASSLAGLRGWRW